MTIALRFAARSDIGMGRYTNNQDSGYAGPHLLAVCDGMGGHAGGDVASSVAVGRLVALDGQSHGGDAVKRLAAALREANDELAHRAHAQPELAGMGTTATILLAYDTKLVLAHIGDSRGYLLRDGELSRITRDHTFVQTLVDDGRITLDEAEQHPQRNIVTRVLSGHPEDEPDLSVREARVGDRYLLCSDGLNKVVSDETIAETLREMRDPAACAESLLQLALRGGVPDNVTCLVAEVVDDRGDGTVVSSTPEVVGAAALHGAGPTSAGEDSPAAKAAALGRTDGEYADEPLGVGPPASRRRWAARILATLVVLAVLSAGGYAAYAWSQKQYYVGADGGAVAIYRGLPQDIGPVSMSSVYERQDLALVDLPEYSREQVRSSITADDLADARAKVTSLRGQSAKCQTPTPGTTATATTSPATAGQTSPAATPSPAASTPTTAPASTPAATPAAPTSASPTASATPTATSTAAADCTGTG